MGNKLSRHLVFFDLDGTIHRQDMFGSFLLWLLLRHPVNLLITVLLLPIIGVWFLVEGFTACNPMSLLLWSCTVGISESRFKKSEHKFSEWFRSKVTVFPKVQKELYSYLSSPYYSVWLITGSPQFLVEKVYRDSPWIFKVNLIASQIQRRCGGWVLNSRCLGKEKVIQLKKKIGDSLYLYSGYSDSFRDTPLLQLCQQRWRVNRKGDLQKMN